ncbi:hypothetical protein F2P81_024755 [Scophthalmus maximus]|uniref:AT-rich interactive domain-containing protein 5B-like n=1 Tax=Scophthalmus maximus TaxID=52904 RepID=A0A6A4RWB9_SCOMX|nr:hypothetical protein F2P81_024755 [Scophthalmus maximus]
MRKETLPRCNFNVTGGILQKSQCELAREENVWLGAPSCQRGSYAFYKSVSSRARADGPVQVWRLGEFYFIRCGPQDPVCIAEVTLLWEDQTRRHLLASARLYFLPEDTPKGRTREHGEKSVDKNPKIPPSHRPPQLSFLNSSRPRMTQVVTVTGSGFGFHDVKQTSL